MRERRSTVAPSGLSHADFTALMDLHQRGLVAFLRGFAESAEQACDLAQDTFSAAWHAAQEGSPPFVAGTPDADLRRWLFHTAYCRGVDVLRRRRLIRWESLETADQTGRASLPPPFEERVIEGEALRAALRQLAPQDAACLLLRVVHGFSAPEVGEIVGETPGVVTKRLSRAKQRLRAAYLAQNPLPQQERL